MIPTYLYSTGLTAPSPRLAHRGAGRNLLEQLQEQRALHILTAQVEQPQALVWPNVGLERSYLSRYWSNETSVSIQYMSNSPMP